jgi:hypothetical protein
MTKGTATAPAYMTSTCCRLSNTSLRAGGIASTPSTVPDARDLIVVKAITPTATREIRTALMSHQSAHYLFAS